MYVVILLIILLILILLQLKILNNDIFYPSIIIYACFILALIFVIIEMQNWDIYISQKTFFIILTGLLLYMFISILMRNTLFTIGKSKYKTCSVNWRNEKVIDIDQIIMIIVDAISIVLALKYFWDIRNIVSSSGGFSSISVMIYQYRIGSVNGTFEKGLSPVSAHGFQILFALSFICIYILAINIVCKCKKTVTWYFVRIIPIFSFLFCSLMAGSRNPFMQVVLGSAVIFYILLRANSSRERKFKLKSAMKFIILGVVILIVFVQLKNFLGRTTEYNFLGYLAEYIAAPIKNFDVFINENLRNSTGLWGRETFVNVWRFIGSLTGNKELTNLPMNKDFVFYNGMSLGNVYTAFREYYFDFGLYGVIILTSIHSFIFTTLYVKLRKTSIEVFKIKINKKMIIYAFIIQALFYFCVDDRLFQAYLSQGNFEAVILMIIFAIWLPRISVNKVR